ncbi:Uncharacterised protein [Chryseobacterium balustinum]|uniref:Plasmid mobilization relaxosome protein MobC n=1 Tax=Chryseobacterium balustinum TaxID=246 RepID=A0AAX2IHS3_9FLAO|nr:hypothetical protein [Chryseobacterium balustinum]SQA87701.1 Uncharacterised protein [Chryseobacterium balustinum]
MDNEREKFGVYRKQDNIFGKIETNINQVAKIANSQKFISETELRIFRIVIRDHHSEKEQNEMFTKIYRLSR